jgi:hypothetical protein
MKTKTVLTVATALALGGVARAAVIDFEADALGPYPNGFSPVGHPTVKFTDTSGADLYIAYYSFQGLGQRSLAVRYDSDGSKLQIDFTVPVTSLSLWFGNDDTTMASYSDRAWLEIWSSGVLVATVNMAMNLDGAMNQSIGYSGVPFDRAFFWYGDANGAPFTHGATRVGFGLTEVVDQIEYTVVPEPASALATAGLLGLAAVGLRRWRQRA